jgi:clan AA aspartic protease (TIGR02281 family)
MTLSNAGIAEDFEFKIPLSQHSSGNYYIAGTLEQGHEVEFLVDTGAGMVTLAESTFRSLSGRAKSKPTRRVAARMADGRTKAINVYTLERLILGADCNVGPLEVAVIPGAANNILGLNVLKKAAPFAIYASPPALALSSCSQVFSNYALSQVD